MFGISCCSLSRKGFTLLHIYDTVTRALVSPQAWDAPPPAFGCANQPAQSSQVAVGYPAGPCTMHGGCSLPCSRPLHGTASCHLPVSSESIHTQQQPGTPGVFGAATGTSQPTLWPPTWTTHGRCSGASWAATTRRSWWSASSASLAACSPAAALLTCRRWPRQFSAESVAICMTHSTAIPVLPLSYRLIVWSLATQPLVGLQLHTRGPAPQDLPQLLRPQHQCVCGAGGSGHAHWTARWRVHPGAGAEPGRLTCALSGNLVLLPFAGFPASASAGVGVCWVDMW